MIELENTAGVLDHNGISIALHDRILGPLDVLLRWYHSIAIIIMLMQTTVQVSTQVSNVCRSWPFTIGKSKDQRLPHISDGDLCLGHRGLTRERTVEICNIQSQWAAASYA